MTASPARSLGWVGGIVWVVVTGIGWILAGAGALIRSVVFGAGPLTFIVLPVLQWAVLRRWIPKAGWWVPATVGGRILGPLVASAFLDAVALVVPHRGPSTLLHVIVGFAVIGTVIGGLQLLVLRRRLPGSGWWVVANAVAWGSAELTAGSMAELAPEGLVAWYLVFWTTNGLMHGVITGTTLVWISRQVEPAPASR